MGSNTLILSGDSNLVSIQLENNENEIISVIEVNEKVKKFDVCIAKFLGDIFDIIASDVVVSMTNSNPISISIKQDNITIDYVVAPYQKK
jgi:hypothetical protein